MASSAKGSSPRSNHNAGKAFRTSECAGSLRAEDEERMRAIASDPDRDPQTKIQALLRLGAERLGVEHGHLTKINVGLGTHTIAATSGPHSVISTGDTSDLSATYCRQVLASGGLCVVHDAPNEGWADDPAYTAYGFDTYLGAKVLVGDQLHGTVCFVDADAREPPFEAGDKALVRGISRVLGRILEEADAKKTEHGLEQRPDLLRRVQEMAQIGGWALDLETNELYWTEETYRLFGIPPDDPLDLETAFALYDAEGRSRFREALTRCREEGIPFNLELPITTADGRRRWIRSQAEPQYENGEVIRLVGTAQDVTGQHKLKQKLHLNRNKLQGLVQHSKPVVFVLDADGTFLLSEGKDLQSIDVAPGEVVGQSVYDLYEGQPELLGYIDQALSGTPVDCEVEVDGVVFDSWYAPYYDAEGAVAGCIGVAADVTERREMEKELRRTQARLQALFEQNPVMVNVHDGEGNLLDPNPRLCEETGYDEEELTGMKVWELDQSLNPERARALWAEMEIGDHVQLEGEYRRRDGSTFPVEVHIRHLDLDGDPQFMAISRNVTDRKKEERRRKQIINRVTDAIVEVDANWRFTLVNQQAEALYGMDEEALLGERFWDVFTEALDTRLETEYRRVMETREPTRLVEYYSGLDGWFDIQVYPNDGGGVAFYFEEVTERKERERRLDAVFNHTYQFTGLMAPDGTLLEANDTALTFGGLDETDVLGKPLWETAWVQTGEESKQRLREAIDRAAAGEFVRYERPIKGQEGKRIVDFSIRPVTNEQGEVTLLIPEARDITEQKAREKALREERNLLERIFKTSPTAITMLDADGQFVRVSDRAQDILGLEKDDVTDRTFNDPDWHITAPDGSAFPEEELPFVQVKKTGESVYDIEHAIEWPDGTRRLLSVSGAPLHDSDGSFAGAVFHLADITERREAKQQLRRSEQRFRGIFEHAGLGVALVNEQGTLLEANPALEDMLAYDSGELRGIHFSTLTHPDDFETDEQRFAELVAGERDRYQLEKRYLRQDGGHFWGRLTVSRQEGPEGTQIVGMVEDIDQQKQQREKLRLFQKVVEQGNDGVLITEGEPLSKPGPRILYANPAFGRTTGYEPEEVVGKTPRILQGPDTEPWILHRLRRQLQQGRKFEGEAINYKKDGTPFINHWSITPVYDEDDTITHWVSVQRDVTEERRMGERLLDVQDEERRRIDQEIHDEMGGLLTALQMSVDLARLQSEEGGGGAACTVVDQLDEIEGLLDELAGVARTISRRLHPSSLDDYGLSRALRSLADQFEGRHGLDVDLHNDVDSGERYSSLVEVTAYRVVQEALWNVVRHAETDTAQVVVHTDEHQLLVHVFDRGVGFDPSAPSDPDTFGLDGMRRRVERLNGKLDVDSAPGDGTRISATLPLTVFTLQQDP